ncbi:MAG: hypothetical protein GX878_09905 [Firmicutes bacterium]|nr:hypothetical protein [Bacillota bacterium]
MEIKEQQIVALGYGKFVRSDRIIALEPIEEKRGPGRRTRVYVDQLPNPIIASRTEQAIITNIVETPPELISANAALELLHDLLDDISQIGPMLRNSIQKEADLDLDILEVKIKDVLDQLSPGGNGA